MIESMNGFLTLLLIIVFIGICLWAWSGKNKKKFDQMAKLPLEENHEDKEQEESHDD